MSDVRTIEAYGILDVLEVEAVDGLLVFHAAMRGGENVRFAMAPGVSKSLRQMLRDAEPAANAQRAENKVVNFVKPKQG